MGIEWARPPSTGQSPALLWGPQRSLGSCLLTDSGVNVTKSGGAGFLAPCYLTYLISISLETLKEVTCYDNMVFVICAEAKALIRKCLKTDVYTTPLCGLPLTLEVT